VSWIYGAIGPHKEIAENLDSLKPYRDQEIIVYCASGRRSAIAIEELKDSGFERLYDGGGYRNIMKGKAVHLARMSEDDN